MNVRAGSAVNLPAFVTT